MYLRPRHPRIVCIAMALARCHFVFLYRRYHIQLFRSSTHSRIMKNLAYLVVGIFFGLALTKGEAISWYRMQEMFRFESFHMYGIFMTAVPVGALSIFILTRFNARSMDGQVI